jgi:DNA primase
VADILARTFPDRFTTAMAKEKRAGKIFVDYLRNVAGATAVAAYSPRAKAKAPVSVRSLGKSFMRAIFASITSTSAMCRGG